MVAREEFEKIFHLTSSRGIWLMTDECYYRFLYEGEPFSIASREGCEGFGAGGGLVVENLLDDRLAHRLRTRSDGGDRRDV